MKDNLTVRRERARHAAKAAQAAADEKRRQRKRNEQAARERRARDLVNARRAKQRARA